MCKNRQKPRPNPHLGTPGTAKKKLMERCDFFAMVVLRFLSFRLVCWETKRPMKTKKPEKKHPKHWKGSLIHRSLYIYIYSSLPVLFNIFLVENFYRHPALSFDQTTASVILLSFTTFVRDADEMVLENKTVSVLFFYSLFFGCSCWARICHSTFG